MGQLIYLRNVATLNLNAERCVGCQMCLSVCPQGVFGIVDGYARISDRDACMECGACARNCPTEAITVRAGVGCATAVINAAVGRKGSSCCCAVEADRDISEPGGPSGGCTGTTCC